MSHPTFDLDVLRTLVAGIELGSFAKAADRVGRSTAAVSAQLKKLEQQAGGPVLRKSGRGMALTPAGEVLLGYARRLLELNDEAQRVLRGADLQGEVRLGLQEDFGEGLLARVLAGFGRAHPRVRVEAQLARNSELLKQLERHRLDLALAWNGGKRMPHTTRVGRLPLRWIGARHASLAPPSPAEPLSLAMLEAPCLMRDAAVAALSRARIPWRIAFTSPSLAGVWAAVDAGLGVTVRTAIGVPASLRLLDGMPALPAIGLDLHRAEASPTAVVQQLESLITAHLREVVAGRPAHA
ncbi:LysR substrate-binding domain-containing protein [Piscinibacter terrae]|uniref:LysR family transcriptional regulator n=1 Tax=Piscinibacter terrae TaxID=2496871 RepID=A0A3N7JX11_9BURK|nr:LysR substrate-binding domain-containing protein [Albitalea terrae]RQP25369.1 LysR family transcriptional regulator [Albitalea terrae]